MCEVSSDWNAHKSEHLRCYIFSAKYMSVLRPYIQTAMNSSQNMWRIVKECTPTLPKVDNICLLNKLFMRKLSGRMASPWPQQMVVGWAEPHTHVHPQHTKMWAVKQYVDLGQRPYNQRMVGHCMLGPSYSLCGEALFQGLPQWSLDTQPGHWCSQRQYIVCICLLALTHPERNTQRCLIRRTLLCQMHCIRFRCLQTGHTHFTIKGKAGVSFDLCKGR